MISEQLARLFYPYGSERTVLRGPARGSRFVVQRGIGVTYAIGTEAAAPRVFAPWVRPGMTVYDVGANKGQMALLFARLVGPAGRVVAFEPAPAEFECLVANLCLNDMEWVHPIQAAATDVSADLTFTYAPERPTQGKLLDVEPTYTNRGADTYTVRGLPLDEVLGTEPWPDFIKVDVEGAAATVFRGARRLLEEGSPRIFIELHGPEEQAGVRDEVLSRGYRAETVDGRPVPDPTDGWHSPLWCYKPA